MKKNTTPARVALAQKFSSEAGLGLPIVRSSGYSRKGNRFIPYEAPSLRVTNNRNNLPQLLAKFALESPTHGAAIQRKAFMIEGLGINLDLLSKTLVKKTEEDLNKYGETINDIHEKISKDYALFSGYALKVIWGNDGYIAHIEHIPFEQVRKGEPNEYGDVDYFVISNNWDESLGVRFERTYALPTFNPEYFKNGVPVNSLGMPEPTEEQIKQAVQVIYKYDYSPSASSGMEFYPLPEYWNCLDSVLTEKEIIIANKSLIDNGFNGKYILSVPFVPTTEEEKRELDSLLKLNYSGAQNHGEVMTLYVNGKEAMPQVDKLEPIEADTYLNVEKATKQSIITGHQIPAILLEYNFGGGFNNRAQEMVVAFEQYQQTKIRQLQTKLERFYKTIFYYLGWDNETVEIVPFTLSKPEEIKEEEPINQGETTLNQD